MELNHQLTPHLKHLRLSGILETLEARHRQAVEGKWSYIEFLERLLQDEVERRGQKQLHLRLRRATLATTKTLETFDFNFNPSLNRQQFLALAAGDYIRDKRNVIICGPTGVGKSHLAHALGHEACRRGFDVLFINAYKMLRTCTAVGPMTVWSAASNSISGPIYSFWMISGLSLFRPLAPATCMMSSMNGTNEAAFYLRPTVPQRNGRAYSAIHSWPRPASTGSVTGPKSSLFAEKVSGRRAARGSNRRCQ